uniref:Uncharacterized protein n=1 Tax=Meloidogyne enterolobii TaxID=390850 RepID=A0A6V7WN06_MELEN|nr:unnamed protein product [Meloidogyne enterolobii]
MKSPKQLVNADNIKNKTGDETLVEELKEEYFNEFNEILGTSSIDGLSTSCGSCCSSKYLIEILKQRIEKLEDENDISSNQKDEKINYFEEEIKKVFLLHNS